MNRFNKLATLICLVAISVTTLPAQDAPELEANGFLKGALQSQPWSDADQWPFAGITTGLKAELFWSDWLLRMTLEGSGDFSNVLDSTTDSRWDSPAPLTATYALGNYSKGVADLKELFLEYLAGDLLVRAGKQLYTWGLADGNNPTDTLNPRWVGTRFTTTLDEQKIAVPGVLAEYSLPDNLGKLEAVFLPLAVPNVLPSVAFDQIVFAGLAGNNFGAPAVSGQRIVLVNADMPSFSASNLEGGFRGLIYLENLTFSLSYLTQLDKYFDLLLTKTLVPGTLGVTAPMTITTQTPVFNRVHQFGGDFATSFAGVELRGEGAFVLTQDGSGKDLYTKNPSLKAVFQLSRSWLDGMVSTSLSWAPTYVVAHQFWDSYSAAEQTSAFQMAQRNGQAYGFENSLGLRVGLTLLGETLKPDALVLVNSAARDYLGTLGATYNLADGWNLKFGASLYGTLIPDSQARELSIFGNSVTDKKDGAYLELRWDY